MDPQTIKVQMPLKGVHRALSRDSQPEGTCFDALNVLPYDRQSRIRICQRPGLGTQKDLGTDAPVRFLHEVGLGGGVSNGQSTVWDEEFAYANGNLTGNGGWTSETSTWLVSSSNAISVALAIKSNLNTSSLSAWTTSQDYTFTIVFSVANGGGTGTNLNFGWGDTANDPQVEGDFTFDTSDSSGPGFDSNIVFQGSKWNGVGNSLTTQYSADTFTFGSDHTFTITRVGTTITFALDAATIGTVTAADAMGTTPFFRLYCSDDENVVTVKSIVLTSGTGGDPSISRARSKLVAVSGTKTFIGSKPSTVAEVTNDASFPIDSASLFVDGATLFGFEYIVDGTHIYKLNLETGVYVAYTASAGSFPTTCTIAVAYRGRLVLSGSDSDSQNIFASRVGDPTDWDYSQTDPAAAWAANSAPSGRVGAPVMALMPLSDDIMLIGCEQSIWKVEGDPADGGTISPVTDSAGISGPHAWCVGEDGRVYFVGPSGFFRANPDGSNPVNIARDVYPQYFAEINRFTTHITLMYDTERHGVWVYLTPEDQDSAPLVSLFYDVRLEGFWPMRFTNLSQVGPLAAIQWDAIGSDARYPLLGGYDGVLYWQTRNRRSDVDISSVSHAIDSYVVLGPISPFEPDNAIITKLDITAGDQLDTESSDFFNMEWEVRGGRTAFSVTEGTPVNVSGGNIPQASQRFVHVPRTRGSWTSIKLSNSTVNNYLVIEALSAYAMYGGKQR